MSEYFYFSTTNEISNEPFNITKMEPMQADPEHTFERCWPVDEQTTPEPSSSLTIGAVFTQYPVKTENDSCYLIETTNDSSPLTDSDDFTYTSSSLNEQQQRYSFRQNCASRFPTESEIESNSDQISDDEDFSLNHDANTDNLDTRSMPRNQIITNEYNAIHTNYLEDGNGTSNFYSDGVQKGFLGRKF